MLNVLWLLLLHHLFIMSAAFRIELSVFLGEFQSVRDLLVNFCLFLFLFTIFLASLLLVVVVGGQWVVNLHLLPTSLIVFSQFFLIKCDMLGCLALLGTLRLENWIDFRSAFSLRLRCGYLARLNHYCLN